MSQQNIIAQQALKKQLIADKRQYCKWGRNQIKYAYADVDGDNVLELITEPGYGYLTQAVYDYQNGIRSGWDLNAVPNLKLGER